MTHVIEFTFKLLGQNFDQCFVLMHKIKICMEGDQRVDVIYHT